MHITRTFNALGDPTRFAIVERLLKEGEMSAGDIVAGAAISAPAISRHLKVLCDAGVLERRIDKQRRMYSASPGALRQISAWTGSYSDFWNARVDRLQAAVEATAPKGTPNG